MELWKKILEAYPQILPADNFENLGIFLQDDSDGQGAYIAKWTYDQPIPDGLTLGKPTA